MIITVNSQGRWTVLLHTRPPGIGQTSTIHRYGRSPDFGAVNPAALASMEEKAGNTPRLCKLHSQRHWI